MDGNSGGRLGSFLIGGLLGSAAGLAAAGRMRVDASRGKRATPEGLAAFEQAPCFRELVELDAGAEDEDEGAVT